MKRITAFILVLCLFAGLWTTFIRVSGENAANYLTHSWEAVFFPGNITETQEEGASVTTYVPSVREPWFSPQLSVFSDLKKMAEGKDYITFYISVELSGVFSGEVQPKDVNFLFRAIDPRTGSFAYSLDETDNWNGKGDAWLDIYGDLLDEGDMVYKIDFGGNVMCGLSPKSVAVDDGWTLFESDPVCVSAAALNDELFGDIILCMGFDGGFANGFDGIRIRNTAIYEYGENTKTPEPEQQPTENPTEPGGEGEQRMVYPEYIFDFKDNSTYSAGFGSACVAEITDDGLLTTVISDDPFVFIGGTYITGSDAPWVVIRYRGESAAERRKGEIYFGTEKNEISELTRIYTEWGKVTEEWQTLIMYSKMLNKLDEEITSVRFDPYTNANGDAEIVMDEWLEVEYIAFFKTEEDANAFDYEKYSTPSAVPTKAPHEGQEGADSWEKPASTERYVIGADNEKGTLSITRDASANTLTVAYGKGKSARSYVVPDNAYFLNGPLSGVDDLGRELPDSHFIIAPDYTTRNENGDPVRYQAAARPVGVYAENGRKYVGLFYFLIHGTMNYDNREPRNIQEMLDKYGDKAKDMPELWGNVGSTFYFAKPLYGYYDSNDEWVIRKHLELLSNAGVDFLYFDVTNNYLYDRTAVKIMELCHELNTQGYAAPKIVFYTNTEAEERVYQAYKLIYSKNLYPDTWFMLDGKPLIIAPEKANIDNFFTIRVPQWPNEPQRDNSWPWIDFDQPAKKHGKDYNEAISASIAQHNGNIEFSSSALYGYKGNRGRSYNGITDEPTADSYKRGENFRQQLNRAIDSGVPYVMITGWNEWIANRMNPMTKEYPICFMDSFDLEYSRDIEMTEGAYFDNYYMQLAAGITSIRGAAPEIIRDDRHAIDIAGDFSQWDNVAHYYTDPSGDAQKRDTNGAAGTHYTNDTGRNDIVRIKVTGDASYLYFYAECADNIKRGSGSDSWMQILLNVDNKTSGWLGYDYVACSKTKGDNVATLARFNGSSYDLTEVADITYQVKGNKMMVAVALEALGIDYFNKISLSFKWIDSRSLINTAEQFYTDGDCAPLGRPDFTYRTYAADAMPKKLMKTVLLSERKAAYETDQKGKDPIKYVDAGTGAARWVVPAAIAGGAAVLAAGAGIGIAASKKRRKKVKAE